MTMYYQPPAEWFPYIEYTVPGGRDEPAQLSAYEHCTYETDEDLVAACYPHTMTGYEAQGIAAYDAVDNREELSNDCLPMGELLLVSPAPSEPPVGDFVNLAPMASDGHYGTLQELPYHAYAQTMDSLVEEYTSPVSDRDVSASGVYPIYSHPAYAHPMQPQASSSFIASSHVASSASYAAGYDAQYAYPAVPHAAVYAQPSPSHDAQYAYPSPPPETHLAPTHDAHYAYPMPSHEGHLAPSRDVQHAYPSPTYDAQYAQASSASYATPAPYGASSSCVAPSLIVSPASYEPAYEAQFASPSSSPSPSQDAQYAYAPPSRTSPTTSRASHRHLISPYPASSPSLSTEPSPSPSPSNPLSSLRVCKRRNVQVDPSPPLSTPSPSASSSSSSSSTRAAGASGRAKRYARVNRWKCPHCEHVQGNRRSPDLRRHIATHSMQQWVCCGVPLVDAKAHGVPFVERAFPFVDAHGVPFVGAQGSGVRFGNAEACGAEEVLADGLEATVWQFEGTVMVGGCRQTFSRRDAYGRHLKREKGRCWGDVAALYQPGNRGDAGGRGS